MKNITLIIVILTLTVSCENQKITELNSRISELEKRNNRLIDSINKIELQNLLSTSILGIPANKNLIPNKKNEFKFLLHTIKEYPKYNVYRIIKNGEKTEKKLLYKNHTKSEFLFNFIPKSKSETSFELLAQFNLDSIVVEMPAIIEMN